MHDWRYVNCFKMQLSRFYLRSKLKNLQELITNKYKLVNKSPVLKYTDYYYYYIQNMTTRKKLNSYKLLSPHFRGNQVSTSMA